MLVDDIRALERRIGASYCGPAALNSTGASASIHATGASEVAQNALSLAATGPLASCFGY